MLFFEPGKQQGKPPLLFTSFKRYKYIFFIIVTSADMIFYSITIRTLFSEDDWKLVQLVLTLFRNVLAIQEITLTQKASGEATHLLFLADSFLELMFQENVMDIILVLTQNIDEPSGYLKEENLLLMEIYHYVFLGRDPGLIARASNKGSKVFLLFVIFFSFCEYYSVFWMPQLSVEKSSNLFTPLILYRIRLTEILFHQLIH
jgi:hypothetical protein